MRKGQSHGLVHNSGIMRQTSAGHGKPAHILGEVLMLPLAHLLELRCVDAPEPLHHLEGNSS
jgi:hypothetical protein